MIDFLELIIGVAGKQGSGKSYTCHLLCNNYNFKITSFSDALKQYVWQGFGVKFLYKDDHLDYDYCNFHPTALKNKIYFLNNLEKLMYKIFNKNKVVDYLSKNKFKVIELQNLVKMYYDAHTTSEMDLYTRKILQLFGDMGRDIDSEIWIKKLNEKINHYLERNEKRIAIDSVRFLNETDYILNDIPNDYKIQSELLYIEDQQKQLNNTVKLTKYSMDNKTQQHISEKELDNVKNYAHYVITNDFTKNFDEKINQLIKNKRRCCNVRSK
jgi:dephospho-CoA kinase